MIGFRVPRSLRAQLAREHRGKILSRAPAPPLPPEHELYKLADPALHRAARGFGALAETYEIKRRAAVLRAWCARRLGWRRDVAENLRLARLFRRAAERARSEGR